MGHPLVLPRSLKGAPPRVGAILQRELIPGRILHGTRRGRHLSIHKSWRNPRPSAARKQTFSFWCKGSRSEYLLLEFCSCFVEKLAEKKIGNLFEFFANGLGEKLSSFFIIFYLLLFAILISYCLQSLHCHSPFIMSNQCKHLNMVYSQQKWPLILGISLIFCFLSDPGKPGVRSLGPDVRPSQTHLV